MIFPNVAVTIPKYTVNEEVGFVVRTLGCLKKELPIKKTQEHMLGLKRRLTELEHKLHISRNVRIKDIETKIKSLNAVSLLEEGLSDATKAELQEKKNVLSLELAKVKAAPFFIHKPGSQAIRKTQIDFYLEKSVLNIAMISPPEDYAKPFFTFVQPPEPEPVIQVDPITTLNEKVRIQAIKNSYIKHKEMVRFKARKRLANLFKQNKINITFPELVKALNNRNIEYLKSLIREQIDESSAKYIYIESVLHAVDIPLNITHNGIYDEFENELSKRQEKGVLDEAAVNALYDEMYPQEYRFLRIEHDIKEKKAAELEAKLAEEEANERQVFFGVCEKCGKQQSRKSMGKYVYSSGISNLKKTWEKCSFCPIEDIKNDKGDYIPCSVCKLKWREAKCEHCEQIKLIKNKVECLNCNKMYSETVIQRHKIKCFFPRKKVPCPHCKKLLYSECLNAHIKKTKKCQPKNKIHCESCNTIYWKWEKHTCFGVPTYEKRIRICTHCNRAIPTESWLYKYKDILVSPNYKIYLPPSCEEPEPEYEVFDFEAHKKKRMAFICDILASVRKDVNEQIRIKKLKKITRKLDKEKTPGIFNELNKMETERNERREELLKVERSKMEMRKKALAEYIEKIQIEADIENTKAQYRDFFSWAEAKRFLFQKKEARQKANQNKIPEEHRLNIPKEHFHTKKGLRRLVLRINREIPEVKCICGKSLKITSEKYHNAMCPIMTMRGTPEEKRKMLRLFFRSKFIVTKEGKIQETKTQIDQPCMTNESNTTAAISEINV